MLLKSSRSLFNSLNFSHNILKMMKGILVHEFGGPEACKYETSIPIPEPNDDQIQIRVHAAGVNPVDTYIRSGTHSRRPALPYTPGGDSAGVITKVGKNIKNFKVGDRVFTCNSDSGTYAEYTISKPMYTFKLDDSLSFEEGSALGIPYFTAYRALFLKGHAKPGETVLIHGASGAVGLACVQLAKSQGLRVIGTAGSEAGLELVKTTGADYVFNHREEGYMDKIKALNPEGLEIIIEMLANVNLANDIQILKWKKGRVMVVGNRGAIEMNPRFLMAKETSVTGITLFTSDEEDFHLMYNHLDALIKQKSIRPVMGHFYSIQEANKAHHDVINNTGTTGRLTLRLD
ncbi:unnamed protein product [Brachionus calyciflorus]|uniref:Enoyl reductase (ER) domain-containing protein n=1 Tax=Brachionus calyciflorus TaxID=104777 RepID=A0A813U8M5_9BILA|nr:unnamed protein product [Brachionus calyciflorus]